MENETSSVCEKETAKPDQFAEQKNGPGDIESTGGPQRSEKIPVLTALLEFDVVRIDKVSVIFNIFTSVFSEENLKSE